MTAAVMGQRGDRKNGCGKKAADNQKNCVWGAGRNLHCDTDSKLGHVLRAEWGKGRFRRPFLLRGNAVRAMIVWKAFSCL